MSQITIINQEKISEAILDDFKIVTPSGSLETVHNNNNNVFAKE